MNFLTLFSTKFPHTYVTRGEISKKPFEFFWHQTIYHANRASSNIHSRQVLSRVICNAFYFIFS